MARAMVAKCGIVGAIVSPCSSGNVTPVPMFAVSLPVQTSASGRHNSMVCTSLSFCHQPSWFWGPQRHSEYHIAVLE